jgi:hypothetical protein
LSSEAVVIGAPRLRRALTLWNLVIIGMVIVQPIAPMGIYGVISNKAGGHVVTTILIAMVAMLFTAISYGKMARAYPSAGSAYTYVGREIHHGFGYLTGWAMVMDYILNPLICTIICSKLTQNILPGMPYWLLAIFYAGFFTLLNLRGVKTSARINDVLAAGMSVVVVVFFVFVIRFLWGLHVYGARFFTQPFYNPATFSFSGVFQGTSIAVLTYIGFDAISTFSEEVENPRRNILLATVLVCVITGVLSSLEVSQRQSGIRFPHRGAAGGRFFSLSAAEFYDSNRQRRFGHRVAIGGRAVALWNGAQRRAAQGIFWQDYRRPPHSAEQRDSDRCAGVAGCVPHQLRTRRGIA